MKWKKQFATFSQQDCGFPTINDGDLVIAADSGYRHLERLSILPDILLGDFDTIENIPENIRQIIKFSPIKDYTDTHLAFIHGENKGYTSFIIYGAIGGKRLEHTISNLQLSCQICQKGYDVILTDGETFIYLIDNGSVFFEKEEKGFFSVFSMTDKANCVSISGAKYDVKNVSLTNNFPLGVSNEFIGKDTTISVENGTILVVTNSKNAKIIDKM